MPETDMYDLTLLYSRTDDLWTSTAMNAVQDPC